MPGGVRA